MIPNEKQPLLSNETSINIENEDILRNTEVVIHTQVYKRRWIVMAAFVFLSIMNNLTQVIYWFRFSAFYLRSVFSCYIDTFERVLRSIIVPVHI